MANLDEGFQIDYQLHNQKNGVYVFLLEGEIIAEDHVLNRRDAVGISETESFSINAKTESKLLIIEVPMA